MSQSAENDARRRRWLTWPCVVCGAEPGERCTPGIRGGWMMFGVHRIRYDTLHAVNPEGFMASFGPRVIPPARTQESAS